MKSPSKKKPPGRPGNPAFIKVPEQVWYMTLRAMSNWTHARFDLEFVWGNEQSQIPEEEKLRRFEKILDKGRVPKPKHPQHADIDMVDLVDQHDQFRGTADLFRSDLWRLLLNDQDFWPEVPKLVRKLLSKYGFIRLKDKPAFLWQELTKANMKHFPLAKKYEQEIDLYLLYLGGLDVAVPTVLELMLLVAALFRESCLAQQYDIADVLAEEFEQITDMFCNEPWLMHAYQGAKPPDDLPWPKILQDLLDQTSTEAPPKEPPRPKGYDKYHRIEQNFRDLTAHFLAVRTGDPILFNSIRKDALRPESIRNPIVCRDNPLAQHFLKCFKELRREWIGQIPRRRLDYMTNLSSLNPLLDEMMISGMFNSTLLPHVMPPLPND